MEKHEENCHCPLQQRRLNLLHATVQLSKQYG